MLNKAGERELAYVVYVDKIEPIPGKDRVECARVGGWTCMVPKGAFKEGDPGIYFEIDSKVPVDKTPFEFCAKYKGHIKTQKFKNPDGSQFWSQGLLMPAAEFGWIVDYAQYAGDFGYIVDDKGVQHIPGTESAFLTKQLGITYYEAEDNKRKANKNPDGAINSALARHPKIAKKYGKFIKKNKVARAIFLLLFGKKKDNRSWIPGVPKTDEERIENQPWTLQDSSKLWVATEKVDGTSTTFYLSRPKVGKKAEYLVCSRNVIFDTPTKVERNYYQDSIGNVYLEMSEKYNMRDVLEALLADRPSAEWVAVQAETFGAGVQKRDYGMKDHEIKVFNLLYSDCGRIGTLEMKKLMEELGVPAVPIISEGMTLPSTIEELREFVHSAPSLIDGGMKEGIVFRTLDGVESFKCVDPEFLVKYHG